MKHRYILYMGILLAVANFVLSTFNACTPPPQSNEPNLEHGDLLFQVFKPSDFSEAVEGVAVGRDSISYSHVGLLSINENDTTVIEAVFKGVREVTLEHYLGNSDTIEGRPIVTVARVKPEFRHLREAAVERAREYIGCSYDFVFSPVNDSIYCSELVALAYLDEDGRSIFSTVPMSFRNMQTGEIDSTWIEHFEKYGAEVPEGVEGTNPSQMSCDEVIEEVYRFF